MPIYKGAAKRLEDIDLPAVGEAIGVGEDVIHALIETETRGTGFDKQGRVLILFEPHKFYGNLRGDKRAQAVEQGLAYPRWGMQKYPRESYTRLEKAIEIDESAALKSASWGLGQIMGENYRMLGFETVQDMVSAFAEDEEAHLKGMIDFIRKAGIDDDLRRIEQKTERGQNVTASDWVPVVRVYNGSGYAKNDYHNRAARAYHKWLKIKNTPYGKEQKLLHAAAEEEAEHEATLDVDVNQDVDINDVPKPETEKPANTTSPEQKPEDTAGTPPPAPAQEIIASRPSVKSAIAAVLAFVMAPLSYFGIDTRVAVEKAGEFAQNNFALAMKILVGFAFAVLAYWIWNKAMDRAHQRTLKVMDAAADKDKNNLRLIDPAQASK